MRTALLLGGLLLGFGSPAHAQPAGSAEVPPSAEGQWGYALSHELMSPFCPGRTLAACPSPQADQLRIWILTQEAAGASRAQVEEMLIERYGEEILSAPRATGVRGLSAYAVPFAGFVLGAGALALALRKIVGSGRSDESANPNAQPPPHAVAATGGSVDAELERLVDEELAN